MILISVRIALILGTVLCSWTTVNGYKTKTSSRKDARFGRPVLAMANSPRCMFNGKNVEDGTTVSSPEPCLNCTCSKGILLCYLRTCSTVVSTPGCHVVRTKGECCPKLECAKTTTDYRFERTSEPSYKYRLRQDDGAFFGLIALDPRTDRSENVRSTSTTRKPYPSYKFNEEEYDGSFKDNEPLDEQEPVAQEEDYSSDDLSPERNDSSGYCYSKGNKYKEGMAMLSPTKCEYCYCIGGQQMCVRPKCHLNIDGCVARYQSGYTCCPSHYQCEVGAQPVGSADYLTTKDNFDIAPNKIKSCNVEGFDFDVGVAVPSNGNCETCYCTQMGVVCRRLECSPSVPGCTPIVPEGHCCPTEYKCDQQNETQAPVSHSTENYDVTVLSTLETDENTSTDEFDMETTDEFNYEMEDEHRETDSDYSSDTTTDKQKITVELTENSDLESISVIPEENIAVLVVTTQEDENPDAAPSDTTTGTQLFSTTSKSNQGLVSLSSLKHKTKTSTTKGDATESEDTNVQPETTKPSIWSLGGLKQKTKTSTTSGGSTENRETGYQQITTKPAIIHMNNLKQKTKISTTVGEITEVKTTRPQDPTIPTLITLSGLKQKTKSSTVVSTPQTGVTKLHDTTKPYLSTHSNLKQKTKTSTTKYSSSKPSEITLSQDDIKSNTPSIANLKQKTKTSTTKYSSSKPSEITISQDDIKSNTPSIANLKQKTKTSTTRIVAESSDYDTFESTPHYHSSRRTDPTTEQNFKHGTHEYPEYYDEDKDGYDYDYIELYEDVSHSDHETFAPFVEYDTTSSEGLLTTEGKRGTTAHSRLKIKNKKPPVKVQTRNPTLQTITAFTNSKFATEGLDTEKTNKMNQNVPTESSSLSESTEQSTTDTYGYTVYATDSIKTYSPYGSTGGRHKQKTKPNIQPVQSTSIQYASSTTKDSTAIPSRNPLTTTRIHQTGDYETTLDHTLHSTNGAETNRPSIQYIKQHNKIISNHKQRPQRPFYTASFHKSTKPLPQDIATLLWTITQKDKDNLGNQDTSTETYLPVKSRNPPLKVEHSVYSPDSQPTFIIAAPKLIVEDTTTSNTHGTLQYDTTNEEPLTGGSVQSSSAPPLPSFNFQSPEIIFSNHGPASLHNQKPSIPDPNPPVIINNHKKTSHRNRPPVTPVRPSQAITHMRPSPPITPARPKLPSTPSVPQTSYVEISNHRPIHSVKRPPGKFPPYPNYSQRSEEEYNKHPYPRDPHHKLHRFDNYPEWREEDYDEYRYDFDQENNPTTRVFTNLKDLQTTGSINVQSSDSYRDRTGSNLYPSTRKNDLTINPVTVASRNTQDDNLGKTESIQESNIDLNYDDDVAGRSSNNRISTTETTPQAIVTTTPLPTTFDVFTSTKKTSEEHFITDDIKSYRLENNDKNVEASVIDSQHNQYQGSLNKFEVSNGRINAEKPMLKPLPSEIGETPVKPITPASEEDSKEINDVCFVDGRYYNSGEIIVKSNPCEMCRCFYGHPLCQVQQCPPPPQPSCTLEYLPGYCCPRVTCGVKSDSAETSDVSAPVPTSQEIRPPIITSDNQWKPLPHGPIVRPVETIPRVGTPENRPIASPAPPRLTESKTADEKTELSKVVHQITREKPKITGVKEHSLNEAAKSNVQSIEHEKHTPAAITPTASISEVTTPGFTEPTTIRILNLEVTTYFPELPTETEPFIEPIQPIFEPGFIFSHSQRNKSEIHDNSSGVRKVLGETINLPPSKMSLSPSSGENVTSILPVIQPLPIISYTDAPELELDTAMNIVGGDLQAELGGSLKVSGCNVYGKYYKINDKVTALSKPCNECICNADGISCSATC